MEIILEVIIYLFFTFGVISFCEKLYNLFFCFNIKRIKKDKKDHIKLVLEIGEYREYVEEILKAVTYGEYENIQEIVDEVIILVKKEDINTIKSSIWFSNNYNIIVKNEENL